MNSEDKKVMDMLLNDKEKRYTVIIDNDSVCVCDKEKDDETIHTFSNFGEHLIQDIFKFLGVDSEMC